MQIKKEGFLTFLNEVRERSLVHGVENGIGIGRNIRAQ